MVRPELSTEAKSFLSEPRPACSMPAAQASPPPSDDSPVNERATVSAIAVVPASERPEEEPPLVDERVDCLLREVFALTRERKQLYEISSHRIRRSNQLLEEARKAKRLVRAMLAEMDDGENGTEALDELRAWAAEPL